MTMIERVAASIVIAQQRGLDRNGVARAAIEAMRDCDNDMLEAMHTAMFEDKFTGHELPMLNAGWVAAIDQALKDEA